VDDTFCRRVGSQLVIEVRGVAELDLQVAVAGMPGAGLREELGVTHNGDPQSVTELNLPGPSRAHVLRASPGRVVVTYQATVEGRAARPEVTEADRLSYLRPSRYAESDKLAVIAAQEFGGITAPNELLGGGGGLGRRAPQLRVRQQ
jgi:hypothetical protein